MYGDAFVQHHALGCRQKKVDKIETFQSNGNRELKRRQRRRQQERHKFAYLVGKNNSFARSARAFFTFVHFFAVVSKTTEIVNTNRRKKYRNTEIVGH